MKTVIQRVTSASVCVDDSIIGQIENGIVILLSVSPNDTNQTADRFIAKVSKIGLFGDENNRLTKTLKDSGAAVLLVSQFTLHANLDKGKTPSFSHAARPDHAQKIYDYLVTALIDSGIPTQTGEFGAYMQLSLVNDGPVTLLLNIDE